MPKLEQQALRQNVFNAGRLLEQAEKLEGRDSEIFQAAQRALLRQWAILKMTRRHNEFLSDVIETHSDN